MKKRAAGIVLALILSASLSGCGISSALAAGTSLSAKEEASEEDTAADVGEESAGETAADSSVSAEESNEDSGEETSSAAASAAEDSSGGDGENDASDAGDPSEETEETDDNYGITFEEQVLVDNEECSITVKSIDPDGKWGYTLDMEVENKSSDKNYYFTKKNTYVNGVYLSAIWSETVNAGKKSVSDLYFYDELLEMLGIETVTDIQMTVYAYDADGSSSDYIAEETVHIYPYGEENATVHERETLETDQVLMDNEYVTVIVTGFETEYDGDYAVNLYLVNKTEEELVYSLDDISIDDYIVETSQGVRLDAGKQCISSFDIEVENLEDIGITDPESEIEEIELLLEIYSSERGYSEALVSETVTILQ